MFLMRGGSKEFDIKEEDDTRNFAFATVVCLENISKGEIISNKNSWPKRPGIRRNKSMGSSKNNRYES